MDATQRQSVLNGTALLHAGCHRMSVKPRKSKKQRDKATLASVAKEMAGPRLAESVRKTEQEANHGATKHDDLTYPQRNGS